MTQFLRPNGDVNDNRWTDGFDVINEVTPDDSDFCYGANNAGNAFLEVSLSSVPQPEAGTVTIRWRHRQVNNGNPSSGGGNPTQTCSIREGATVLDSATVTPGGSWVQGSFTISTADVSDWSDLRLRWEQSGSGGGGNARGTAVSWAEVEAPPELPPPSTRYILIT